MNNNENSGTEGVQQAWVRFLDAEFEPSGDGPITVGFECVHPPNIHGQVGLMAKGEQVNEGYIRVRLT